MNARSASAPGRAWALCLCVLVLCGCAPDQKSNPVGGGAELPDQEVTDFVLTETDEGRPQWTLYARYAATYQAKNLVISRDIRVDFFDDKGERSSELTARQ